MISQRRSSVRQIADTEDETVREWDRAGRGLRPAL